MMISKTGGGRIPYLDGIRGVASVMVVLCHIAFVFVPGLYNASLAENDFQSFWVGSPFNVLTYGNMPVQIFFVLSGYLICMNAYEHKKIVNPIKEYWKLLRIVVPAVFLMAILMNYNLLFHLEIPHFNPDIVKCNNFNPSFFSAFSDALVKTFVNTSTYVDPLWYIKNEFLGAVLISTITYSFSSFEKRSQYFSYFAVAAIFFIISSVLVAFVWGALAYVVTSNVCKPNLCKIERLLYKTFYGKNTIVLLIIIFFIGLYMATVSRDVQGIYKPFSYVTISSGQLGVVRSLGVAICLICITTRFDSLRRAFSFRIFIWLGSISAYTYALHWPIILSLGCWLYLTYNPAMSRYPLIAIITVSVMLTTLIVAFFVTKIDRMIFCNNRSKKISQ